MDHSVWACVLDTQSQVSESLTREVENMPRTFCSSYISEAAASLLDERLELHIVPRTELVSLSSPVRAIVITCGRELTETTGLLL